MSSEGEIQWIVRAIMQESMSHVLIHSDIPAMINREMSDLRVGEKKNVSKVHGFLLLFDPLR